jgi:hypothetical protein
VASNQTGVGIKTYNDRKKYKEWEFVYDYRKPKGKPATPTPAGTNPNPASTNLLNSRTPTGPNQ